MPFSKLDTRRGITGAPSLPPKSSILLSADGSDTTIVLTEKRGEIVTEPDVCVPEVCVAEEAADHQISLPSIVEEPRSLDFPSRELGDGSHTAEQELGEEDLMTDLPSVQGKPQIAGLDGHKLSDISLSPHTTSKATVGGRSEEHLVEQTSAAEVKVAGNGTNHSPQRLARSLADTPESLRIIETCSRGDLAAIPGLSSVAQEPQDFPSDLASSDDEPQRPTLSTVHRPGASNASDFSKSPFSYTRAGILTSSSVLADHTIPVQPHSEVLSSSSIQSSVPFASLPPRQPFAKKSMGHRASHRNSIREGSQSKGHPTNFYGCRQQAEECVKDEPVSASKILGNFLQSKPTVPMEMPSSLPAVSSIDIGLDQQPISKQVQPAIDTADGWANHKFASQSQRIHDQLNNLKNNCQARATSGEKRYISLRTSDDPTDKIENTITRIAGEVGHTDEDEEWVPKLSDLGVIMSRTDHSKLSQAADRIEMSHRPEQIKATSVASIGPIQAAIQAAKAHSLAALKQVKTAFASPAPTRIQATATTTPLASPAKTKIKDEVETPKIYPDLKSIRQTAIPHFTRSPTKVKQELSASLRTSPRNPPQKISNSLLKSPLKSQTIHIDGPDLADHTERREEDPENVATKKNLAKFLAVPRAKPVSIRVATASQREIDHSLQRKFQAPPTFGTSIGPTDGVTPMTRSTSEHKELESLSRSQSGNQAKRVIPSRQIKALTAANQAKEKADRDRDRRDHQKREVEKKRQENARRLVDEEERKKAELKSEQATVRKPTEKEGDNNKKRKAGIEGRAPSTKKLLRSMPSKIDTGETSVSTEKSIDVSSVTDQAPAKRPLSGIQESLSFTSKMMSAHDAKRRMTDTKEEPALSMKPVRVSLQKREALKVTYGRPGEPGYQKPSTSHSKSTIDIVKFSTDHIRFGHDKTRTNQPVLLPPSESIELPDIASE